VVDGQAQIKFPRYFRLYIPDDCVLVIRACDDSKWLEIRGSYDEDPESPFQQAIDGMEAGHVSGLFSLGVEVVHKDHPSWLHVCDLWKRAVG